METGKFFLQHRNMTFITQFNGPMRNEMMDSELLLRADSVPREAPYYCFEFVLYDTKKSFGVFYETNFPKFSRLFALGLTRCMFFTNASKVPLDMKAKVVEKRFWWDFTYDKMERCGGHRSLVFDNGQRLGVFKLVESSVQTKEVDSLVPGLKGLLVTGDQRLLLSLGAKDNKTRLTVKEISEACRNLLTTPGCFGHVIYKRISDLNPENHSESDVYAVVELLFKKDGIIGCGQTLVDMKKDLQSQGTYLQWGIFNEERFLPVEYPHNMRYPSIIGRLHGF